MLLLPGPVLWSHRKQTFTKKDLGKIPERFDPIGFSEKLWYYYNRHEVLDDVTMASLTANTRTLTEDAEALKTPVGLVQILPDPGGLLFPVDDDG